MTVKTSYRDLINPISEKTKKENYVKAKDIIAKMRNKLKGGHTRGCI